jgi:hypothetical protein
MSDIKVSLPVTIVSPRMIMIRWSNIRPWSPPGASPTPRARSCASSLRLTSS